MPILTTAARALAVVSVAAVLFACAQSPTGPTYRYEPPTRQQDLRNQRQVAASYDDTWTGLIDHVARTSFTIDQFEKESGLLTLTYGQSDISRFVNCGNWYEDGQSQLYAARSDQGLDLDGRMNIRVQERGPSLTDVRIDSLYVLRNNSGQVWQFTTNERATVDLGTTGAAGTLPTRTCQSTHEAERLILTGIEAVASTR